MSVTVQTVMTENSIEICTQGTVLCQMVLFHVLNKMVKIQISSFPMHFTANLVMACKKCMNGIIEKNVWTLQTEAECTF